MRDKAYTLKVREWNLLAEFDISDAQRYEIHKWTRNLPDDRDVTFDINEIEIWTLAEWLIAHVRIIESALAQLPGDGEWEWLRCEDCLPPRDECQFSIWVMARDAKGEECKAYMNYETGDWITPLESKNGGEDVPGVTHWRPLAGEGSEK